MSGRLRHRLRDRLLAPIADPRDRREAAADLEELRRRHAAELGPLRAGVWYWWELVRYGARLRLGPGGALRPGHLLDSAWQDVRFTLRGSARAPATVLVALPTIALGVGATTAIFSFADALVLRPLPVPEPDRLVSLWHVSTNSPPSYSSFSYPDYVDIRDRASALAGVAAYSSVELRLGEGTDAERIEGQIVSWSYFDVLGLQPLVGRWFTAEEDRMPGADLVVVIGEDLWRRRFSGDPGVLGRELILEGRPFTVVGVAPSETPSGDLQASPELWVPLMTHPVVLAGFRAFGTELFGNRGTHWLDLVGRLRPGLDRGPAEAQLRALAVAQGEEHPETNAGWSIGVVRAGDQRGGPPDARRLVGLTGLLAGVVAMVLLIACANVANLLLAKATVRRSEMGVRMAIGAGRRRLARQVLTEALLLSLVGGAAGVLLALWLMRLLPDLGITAALPGLDVRLDQRVLGFALGASVLSGAVFGLVPALEASAVNVAGSGRRWDEAGFGRGGRALQRGLVVVQVALSLVLLVGAGLTLRTLWNLRAVPLGFDAATVQIAPLDLPESPMTPRREDRAEVQRQILDRVRVLPGVERASLALISPFSSNRMANDVLWEAGDTTGSLSRTNVDMNVVDVGYFETMGIGLVRGRAFTDDDGAGATDAVVVNQALADALWPGRDPIGQRLWSWNPDGPDRSMEVVGVAANGRYYRSWLSADRPFAFLPLAQNPMRGMTLHVRGTSPTEPTAVELRRAILEIDPAIGPPSVRRLRDAQSESIALQRMNARLLGLFGALAAAIAGMGIYGVVSFGVSRRTHEIGVRVALGARPSDVRRFVVLGSLGPVVAGTLLGGVTAVALGRSIEGLLYAVGPRDPVTLVVVAVGLFAVGVVASWVPARRATRVSAVEALGG